jgi:DNA-binding transcriptional regulator/RsmH inhibitor MraZ
MDIISTIIVTAFLTITINSIVSILVFSRYQKSIELSFAKQLEEFKANLQYTNFEQQTKFVRSHQKRVETLDTLCHQFGEFSKEITIVGRKTMMKIWDKESIPKDEFEKKIDKGFEKLYEVSTLLHNNQIYLPKSTFVEIREILKKSGDAALLSMSFGSLSSQMAISIKFTNESIKTSGLAVKKVNPKRPDDILFIQEVINEIEGLRERMGQIYKSEAELKTD